MAGICDTSDNYANLFCVVDPFPFVCTVDFTADIFPGLFHRGYGQVCETNEIAFVAICVRSSYNMSGLYIVGLEPSGLA